jgi:hypothetical protein
MAWAFLFGGLGVKGWAILAIQGPPKPKDRKCISSPSSMVNAAPHLGHLTCVGFILISEQPREKAAKMPTARNVATNFFIPNISFGDIFDDIL